MSDRPESAPKCAPKSALGAPKMGAPKSRACAYRDNFEAGRPEERPRYRGAHFGAHHRGEEKGASSQHPDLFTQPAPEDLDPAQRYPTPAARRAAWNAWEAAGSPWPPPAGLASASLDAAMRRPGHERQERRR
jgi:hypothetical protein